MSSYHRAPFTISAESVAGQRSGIRHNAASAMCLADEWAEDGCSNVRVTDAEGLSRDRQQFRATYASSDWPLRDGKVSSPAD